jgi:hypothetical protein
MKPSWKQADVFPLIADSIREAASDDAGYVSSQNIASRLLQNIQARQIIEAAQEQLPERPSIDWLATNMVAWFSQRITTGQSEWECEFKRIKIDGKWAYRPEEGEKPPSGD